MKASAHVLLAALLVGCLLGNIHAGHTSGNVANGKTGGGNTGVTAVLRGAGEGQTSGSGAEELEGSHFDIVDPLSGPNGEDFIRCIQLAKAAAEGEGVDELRAKRDMPLKISKDLVGLWMPKQGVNMRTLKAPPAYILEKLRKLRVKLQYFEYNPESKKWTKGFTVDPTNAEQEEGLGEGQLPAVTVNFTLVRTPRGATRSPLITKASQIGDGVHTAEGGYAHYVLLVPHFE